MKLTANEAARWTNFLTTNKTDVVVVGAGIAGLSFALRLPASIKITVITKDRLGESNTRYAQGGMAAAIGPEDTPELHLQDTIDAGAGLTDINATTGLVERGASAVRWLLKQGAQFDLDGNTLQLGNEAAHSRRRILHAGGDATGAEIERALVARIRQRPNTRILENCFAADLVMNTDGSAGGVTVLYKNGISGRILARATILANGGAGQLWSITTNPAGATADGLAMGLRAGAELADLEFAQFHPTILYKEGVTPFLISEAVRGEGAWLVNTSGERFMLEIDPRGELAPRDMVAAEIHRQLTRQPGNHVYLDVRHLDRDHMSERFPTIMARLQDVGISMCDDLIPVAPAAHYFMGGIVADTEGQTSIPRLLAIGEVASTGVHGANRLASNSLLEGLVFGINASDALENRGLPDAGEPEPAHITHQEEFVDSLPERDVLRSEMMASVGVERSRKSLEHALATTEKIIDRGPSTDIRAMISRNMRLVSKQIIISALNREESRGGHRRIDFPGTDPSLNGMHQIVRSQPGSPEADIERSFEPLRARRLESVER